MNEDKQVAATNIGQPWSPEVIINKTVKGVSALVIRQGFVASFNLLGGILLARLLTPAEFGIYAIITFLMSFLVTFGDVGLGASLVRQNEQPTRHELRSIFTVQQGLVLSATLLFWVISPNLGQIYHISANEIWLIRIASLTIFITSFQVIPSIQLERRLEFGTLALVEVSQSLVFNSVAVVSAVLGLGVTSFILALLLRSITGAILANRVSPWQIGWEWDWRLIKSHLKFGVPYQGINFLSLIKDSITPLLVGSLLGTIPLGYVNWAQMVAAYPVLALMVLQRIYLPSFARLQNSPKELARFVENVLKATNGIVAFISIGFLSMSFFITKFIYGEKWFAALPIFYFLWAANIFVPTATPLLGLLNGLGYSNISFLFSFIWMASTWILGFPLINKYGAIGFGIANALVQLTNILLFWVARKKLSFHIIRPIIPFWICALFAGGFTYFLLTIYIPTNFFDLIKVGVIYSIIYLSGVYIFQRSEINSLLRIAKGMIWKPKSLS